MAKFVVKHRGTVLATAVLLLIVSVFGYIGTRINYDILSYLPSDLESMEGEQLLENDFNIASTAILTVEGMHSSDVEDMEKELREIEGVQTVFGVYDAVDASVAKEILPEQAQEMLYGKNDATMLIVRFDQSSASDETMDAIVQIKQTMRKDCFLGGMSVILEDTKELVEQELPKYIICAVICSLIVLFLFLENSCIYH